MPANGNSPVNLDELKEIMDDDMELIRECFDEFLKDWPGLYVEIKGAILEKDAGRLDESAHRLKGTLKYLAAEPAADAAYALEKAGRENNFSGTENKLENLKTECQALVEYIKTFTA